MQSPKGRVDTPNKLSRSLHPDLQGCWYWETSQPDSHQNIFFSNLLFLTNKKKNSGACSAAYVFLSPCEKLIPLALRKSVQKKKDFLWVIGSCLTNTAQQRASFCIIILVQEFLCEILKPQVHAVINVSFVVKLVSNLLAQCRFYIALIDKERVYSCCSRRKKIWTKNKFKDFTVSLWLL